VALGLLLVVVVFRVLFLLCVALVPGALLLPLVLLVLFVLLRSLRLLSH
jgi:hypothetical protein